MSRCQSFNVKDHFFGELPDTANHLAACAECAAELDQLRAVRGALLTLREEEPPQRIGFVSDKIFEPSPLRRFFNSFWLSGARLGFAGAAMLSVSLLVFSARMQPKVIERRVEVAAATQQQQVDVNAAIAKAVSAAMAEQEKKTRALLAASDQKHQLEERALAIRVADYTTNLEKTMATQNKLLSMNFNTGAPQQ
jgi:hypothetical protein